MGSAVDQHMDAGVVEGQRLKALREAAQITVKQLAAEVGYTEVWIYMLERGDRRATPETAARLAAGVKSIQRARARAVERLLVEITGEAATC